MLANVFLDSLDHFVKDRMRMPGYVRYVEPQQQPTRQPEQQCWFPRGEHFAASETLAMPESECIDRVSGCPSERA